MDLRAIDRLIAEKVMQIPQPPMEARITRCGANQVSVTGSVFRLRTGDEVPVPDGRLLQQPEGTTDWNDRYYHVVGMFLYSKYDWFKKEVEAYRDPAAPYSTSAAAAKQVREKLATWPFSKRQAFDLVFQDECVPSFKLRFAALVVLVVMLPA